MMTKTIPLAVLPILLFACAHGKTDNFPTVANTADAAGVYVIRDNNFMGWGFSLRVMLNESIIARLRSGEFVFFYVEPGFHSVGISEPTLTVPFVKGRTYYFLIGADYTQFGFNIQRISDRKGELWLSRTKPLK
jgi:hypothetical protein